MTEHNIFANHVRLSNKTCPCSSMTSWKNVLCISATMEFAMKDIFLSCPVASKARRTFMNSSDTVGILRIGLLLVLCHPSPIKESPISLSSGVKTHMDCCCRRSSVAGRILVVQVVLLGKKVSFPYVMEDVMIPWCIQEVRVKRPSLCLGFT